MYTKNTNMYTYTKHTSISTVYFIWFFSLIWFILNGYCFSYRKESHREFKQAAQRCVANRVKVHDLNLVIVTIESSWCSSRPGQLPPQHLSNRLHSWFIMTQIMDLRQCALKKKNLIKKKKPCRITENWSCIQFKSPVFLPTIKGHCILSRVDSRIF